MLIRNLHNTIQKTGLIPKFLTVIPNVVTEEEEILLLDFIKPKFARKRYQGNHWDSVISKYKESELDLDNIQSESLLIVMNRIKSCLREITQLPNMRIQTPHIIDIAHEGFIGPHVDSVKFSGGMVASLSLMSSRIMRLTPSVDRDVLASSKFYKDYYYHMKSNPMIDETIQDLVKQHTISVNLPTLLVDTDASEKDHNKFIETDAIEIEVLLPARSLYIITGPLRYEYNHQILGTNCKSNLFGIDVVPKV